ncbi:MAG: PIG-L deacetylase family protein [Acidobacteriota bacterium]
MSPHLDDGVLSCASLLGRAARPVIATFFSEGDELYAARRAEDREACRRLGAECRQLGLRDDRVRNFREIVRAPTPVTKRSQRALAALLAELNPELVLAPLGVGHHVDHREVREAATALVEPGRLLYYEDRPYALVRGQVEFTLGLRPAPDWRSYFAAQYVKTSLGAYPRERVKAAWGAAAPLAGFECVRELPPPDLWPLGAYATQLGDLFASPAAMERSYAGRPERYWARTPA